MSKRRALRQQANSDPPEILSETQSIVKVISINGNNLYTISFPPCSSPSLSIDSVTLEEDLNSSLDLQIHASKAITLNEDTDADTNTKGGGEGEGDGAERRGLVELPPRFRNAVWIRRGGHVLIDSAPFSGRENKLVGEICGIIQDEKAWRKMDYWPWPRSSTVGKGKNEDEDEDGEERGGGGWNQRVESSDDEE